MHQAQGNLSAAEKRRIKRLVIKGRPGGQVVIDQILNQASKRGNGHNGHDGNGHKHREPATCRRNHNHGGIH